MNKLRTIVNWLDQNLLLLCSFFLLAFIPLYPKIPLFDALPGYIVKVRVEDFLVIFTGLVWLIGVVRKRIEWNTSFFWFVVIYAAAGLLSIALGVTLLDTIPKQLLHVGKSGLTWARYLEYFSLFFFFFSAIKTRRQIGIALIISIVTLLGVVAFGIGQKYAHFPVYSTMNREYSKGGKLYLQEGAKPQSTFAGHYDLAAYLVIILPILFSFALTKIQEKFSLKSWLIAAVVMAAHFAGLFMLVLTASATALGGYGIAMILVALLHLWGLPTIKQRLLWGGIGLILGIVGLTGVWMIAPATTKEKALRLVFGQAASDKPTDLLGDGYEDKRVGTAQPDGTIKYAIVRQKSSWSDNALKYGISMGIRLDTLWPQALLGLARSPLTGSGYGTLAMLDTKGFIEADSTDNNFLRTLGETGVFGFLIFYGIILFAAIRALSSGRKSDAVTKGLSIGFFAATIGLLITAVYLDVFAASKVAFTFWALAGIILRATYLHKPASLLTPFHALKKHLFSHWPLYLTIVIAFFLLHQNPFLQHTPTKDIEQATQGLQSITSSRCFLSTGRFSLCRNSGLTAWSYFSLYALLLVPVLKLTSMYGVFSYVNLGLILLSVLATYLYIRKRTAPLGTMVILFFGVLLAAYFHLTQAPLTQSAFFLIVAFPLIGLALTFILRKPRMQQIGALIVVILLGVTLRTDHTLIRFRNLAANYASESVQVANASIAKSATKPAYLITALNPYFVDLYAYPNYFLLPLSPHQAYTNERAAVWEQVKSPQEVIGESNVFISDYNAQKGQTYNQDYENLKKDFDFNYIRLGCNETCNILKLKEATPQVSTDPLAVFTNTKMQVAKIPSTYQFAVINNMFYPPYQDTTITYLTAIFTHRLVPHQKTNQAFAVITGDAIHSPEKVHAGFMQSFAKNTSYPILYEQGNEKILPVKYFPGGFQSFFTDTEYFILLDVNPDSKLGDDERLRLYDAFLQLEKLPNIKSLFIISHDLNWQDTDDKENAIHSIQKKLTDFPNLKTYILTANHKTNLIKAESWYDTKTDGNTTYAAGLTAGNTQDVYLQVKVDNGVVTVNQKMLNQ